MDNSFRLQLLHTKRELQSTINQIDNILFYQDIVPPPRSNISRPRQESTRQFLDGLINILGNRNFSSSINTSPTQNSRYNPYNVSPISTSPNVNSTISTSPSSNSFISTSSINYPHSSNSTSVVNTSPYMNPLFGTSNSNFGEVIPDLVEVTLYTQGQSQNNMDDVNVTPDINVLTSASSIHIYDTLETEFESCSICMENFSSNSIVRKINNCGHIFHVDCVDTWFESNITCPVCRNDLREESQN